MCVCLCEHTHVYIQVTVLKEGVEDLSNFENMSYMGDTGKGPSCCFMFLPQRTRQILMEKLNIFLIICLLSCHFFDYHMNYYIRDHYGNHTYTSTSL